MTTDDDEVTVTRFDAAAVVRGRTVRTFVLAGTRQTVVYRFTDVCIKRDGAWQIVASHQTSAAK
jgi:Calcium/calmodulin dependent protein kinase II association domain